MFIFSTWPGLNHSPGNFLIAAELISARCLD
jgi:hypothetical protein